MRLHLHAARTTGKAYNAEVQRAVVGHPLAIKTLLVRGECDGEAAVESDCHGNASADSNSALSNSALTLLLGPSTLAFDLHACARELGVGERSLRLVDRATLDAGTWSMLNEDVRGLLAEARASTGTGTDRACTSTAALLRSLAVGPFLPARVSRVLVDASVVRAADEGRSLVSLLVGAVDGREDTAMSVEYSWAECRAHLLQAHVDVDDDKRFITVLDSAMRAIKKPPLKCVPAPVVALPPPQWTTTATALCPRDTDLFADLHFSVDRRLLDEACKGDKGDGGYGNGDNNGDTDVNGDDVRRRIVCPGCKRRRQIYCYDCLVTLDVRGVTFPRMRLPVKMDIIQHVCELRSRNTGVHAAVLAPADVRLLPMDGYAELMAGKDLSRTAVLYPGENSRDIAEWPIDQLRAIERLVVIDGPWAQARKMIAKNPIVLSFPHISLGGETGCDGRGDASDDTSQSSAIRTRFWRSSNRDAKCVSTIEALYWFLRLRGERLGESDAATAYDDLLLLFAHQHAIVRDAMRTRLERRRLRDAQSEVTDVVAVGK